MTKRRKRMLAIAALLVGLTLAAILGFTAFKKNMMYFYTPSDLLAGDVPTNAQMRLGGLVVTGSVKRGEGTEVRFTLKDCSKSIPVRYNGILPDLFREGQGIVATGYLSDAHVFVATQVLAKHDENYMPPQLASALKGKDGRHSCMPFKSMQQASITP